jgi:hypothetical protein
MVSNLFAYLKHEQQLLEEMVSLAEKQQKALIKFDVTMLDEITSYQEVVAKSIRLAEERRISLLMNWLTLSRKEAVALKLSSLDSHFKNDELKEFRKIRASLKGLLSRLQGLNSINRALANRARNSVAEMISHFTNGKNYLCNVKV